MATITSGSDFASVLSAAQQRPTGDDNGRELVDGFPFQPPSTHSVVTTADDDPNAVPGVVRYNAKVHRKVFTIWRDWTNCSRCKDGIATGQIVLPPVGEYECEHNQKAEYEEVVNEILAGRLILGSEEEIVQQRDGSVLVSLRWFSKILSKKEKRALAKDRALSGP